MVLRLADTETYTTALMLVKGSGAKGSNSDLAAPRNRCRQDVHDCMTFFELTLRRYGRELQDITG